VDSAGTAGQLDAKETGLSLAVRAEALYAVGQAAEGSAVAAESVAHLDDAQGGSLELALLTEGHGMHLAGRSEEGRHQARAAGDVLTAAWGETHMYAEMARFSLAAMSEGPMPDKPSVAEGSWLMEHVVENGRAPILHLRQGEALKRLYGEMY